MKLVDAAAVLTNIFYKKKVHCGHDHKCTFFYNNDIYLLRKKKSLFQRVRSLLTGDDQSNRQPACEAIGASTGIVGLDKGGGSVKLANEWRYFNQELAANVGSMVAVTRGV